MVELDAIKFFLEGAHGLAISSIFLSWQLAFFMTWSIMSCESPLTSRRLMPISMAIRRPQRRASYSAMLLDVGKCKRTAYLMCSPRGEMKSRPAPAPVFITDPSK
jgi:hypothetical protein